MSETTTEDTNVTTETVNDTTATDTTDTFNEVEKWKALARKNEERAKANAEAAKRLAEIEDANKSEIERAIQRADDAEKRAAQLELESIRNTVALSKGLTPSQAKRLVGTTREELEADADDLLADLRVNKPAAAATSDGQGRTGEAVGSGKQITREQLKSMSRDEIVQAEKSGLLNDALGRK